MADLFRAAAETVTMRHSAMLFGEDTRPYRLNHDVAAMSSAEFRGISLFALEDVIRRLLDGTWGKTLPDPRK